MVGGVSKGSSGGLPDDWVRQQYVVSISDMAFHMIILMIVD